MKKINKYKKFIEGNLSEIDKITFKFSKKVLIYLMTKRRTKDHHYILYDGNDSYIELINTSMKSGINSFKDGIDPFIINIIINSIKRNLLFILGSNVEIINTKDIYDFFYRDNYSLPYEAFIKSKNFDYRAKYGVQNKYLDYFHRFQRLKILSADKDKILQDLFLFIEILFEISLNNDNKDYLTFKEFVNFCTDFFNEFLDNDLKELYSQDKDKYFLDVKENTKIKEKDND